MDLDAHLLALLAPTRPGEALFPGVVLERVSSEAGWRVTVSVSAGVGRREVHLDVEPFDDARPFAARTERLAFSYRLGRGGPEVDPALGRRLCAAIAHRVAPREAAVLAQMAAEAARAREEDGARVRDVRVRRALEPLGTPEARYFGLTPYAGCVIGCRFCYAQSRLRAVRRLEGLDDVRWGSYVDVRVDLPERLAEELLTTPAHAIKLCPILSDPYQPIEARRGITRACLEVIRDAPQSPTVLVLTRSSLVLRDVALLASIAGAHAGVSLPTCDDEVRRHFEPRATPIEERLDVLRTLRAQGVRTFAIVQPILPGPLDRLADQLAETVESVRIDVLHGVEGAAADFADPRHARAADPAWQRAQSEALDAALRARGVKVWRGELPPAEP
ncbi:MAG: radical SAM protein [Myxococcales bacterium]|nr:radical SAM protein [Myxococcales bacterium]